MPDLDEIEGAIALEDEIAEDPEFTFDQALSRLQGVVIDFRGAGELSAYLLHSRRHAMEAMVDLVAVNPDDKTKVIALQGRIGDYLRLCNYVTDVLSVAKAKKFADDIDVGGVGDGEESIVSRKRNRQRFGSDGAPNGSGGNRST